jgi:spore coat protein CotH
MSLTLRRHYKLIVLLVLVTLGLTLGIGNLRVIAYNIGENRGNTSNDSSQDLAGFDYTNSIDLFDDTVVHTIQIIMDEEDYQTMLSTYQQTGEKDYFHADVIIDGVRVNNVGIRLKGNASLQTAVGGRMGMGGGNRQFGGGAMPEIGNLPQAPADGAMPGQGNRSQPPAGMELPDTGNLPQPPAGVQLPQDVLPFNGGASPQAAGETKIPLMIKFNEFVSGQTYHGYTSFAIRTYGTSYDAAMLQEPVTNAMFRLAGLPAPLTAYAGVSLNDDAEQLFVISEVINQTYLDHNFSYSGGILYKAELGSTLSYQGDDPSAYSDSFTQQTRVNDADLAPLIEFMRFLSESDDATFESGLPEYLDVDSFATYLALCSLLVNNDSIIGMNNNYYLYYDDVAERFTLLYWDGNESLSKLGGSAQAATSLLGDQSQRSFRGPMGGGSNVLLSRFVASETFYALYEQKLQEVYQQVFVSGAIADQVEQFSETVSAANQTRSLVDSTAYDAAVASVLNFITERLNYLTTDPLISASGG